MSTRIVKMAEMDVVCRDEEKPVCIKTTLGSCVGILLSNGKRGMHGLAHVMLPERLREDNAIGKYADTALPALLSCMEKMGSRRKELTASVVGGACMFHFGGENGYTHVGQKNIEAVRRILAEMEIPVVFEDTGGANGRTVIFDVLTGEIEVKTLQHVQPLSGGVKKKKKKKAATARRDETARVNR